MALSLCSNRWSTMITAIDLVISTFLVTFVRYTILTWMKVLIVNTSESTGGAAVAAHRLMDALRANGVEAEMLVRNRSTSDFLPSTSPMWAQTSPRALSLRQPM